jgi:hypothetical protein
VTPGERADLTEAMVPEAANLAVLVHDADTERIAEFMTRFGVTVPEGASPDDAAARLAALLVVLAALVPVDDRSPGDLLAWEGSVPEAVKWRQMPLMAAAEPEPCPSYAAYRRHKARGEDTEACGCGEAARAVWRGRKRDAAKGQAA